MCRTKAGNAPKKRGPKSIWGAFILKRLRARNRPMSYDELIADAMSIHKIPEARMKSAKASILNSAFRLRAIAGKVTTIGELGKKEKFLVSTAWLNEKGQLPKAHMKWLKEMKNFTPERVDVNTIPVAKYEEDLAG